MSNNKCLMDIICNDGKTFMDSHVRKVFQRRLGWLWRCVSRPGSPVRHTALYYRVHCWSSPLELSCQGWREEEKNTSREAWSSWLWHSSSSPEWKLPPCPMTSSPGPSVLLGEALQPKISSVICFPSQKKKKSDVGHLAPWETTTANWILKIKFNLACIKVYLKKSSGKSFVMWGISLEREKATLDASFV